MKMASKKSNTKTSSTARVVDGKLILSFPDALTPVVWQMDLTQAKASAMEVREKENSSLLVLKTAKGETTDIAPFATKQEAIEALMITARALENAHGQIRPLSVGANDTAPFIQSEKGRKGSRWVATGLGLLMVFILFGIWAALTPKPPASVGSAGQISGSGTNFGATEENGIPLSADDVLRKRPSR